MNDRTGKQTSNLAACLLIPNLERHPHKTACLCDGEAVSYRQLGDGAFRFAAMLSANGIDRGDRVLIALRDSPVFIAAFLGATMIGAVAVAVSASLAGEQYDYILDDCNARLTIVSPCVATTGFPTGKAPCIVCGERLSPTLADFPAIPVPPVQPGVDELAFMLYTSGSTGTPKGVPHRHADLVELAERYAVQVLGMGADDIVLSASKLSFAYGLGNSLAFPLYVGATTVLHPGAPAPDQLLSLMERHSPSLFFAVPTVYAQIIRGTSQEHLTLPMRLCVSAGEALPAALFHEWRRLTGLELLDGIGSTELTHIYISNRPGCAIPGSVGQPVPGYELSLVDDAGRAVPCGHAGHLLVRGPGSAPYYWNQPAKSAETMLSNGFIRTGDIFLQQDGAYIHKGRSDDMLKAGGQWISPVQVEDALRTHPSVADCAVAACRVGGLERPAAHVVLRPGLSPASSLERELRVHLSTRVPDYMCPLLYRFVDDLPRTSTGKVQRFKLKQ